MQLKNVNCKFQKPKPVIYQRLSIVNITKCVAYVCAYVMVFIDQRVTYMYMCISKHPTADVGDASF